MASKGRLPCRHRYLEVTFASKSVVGGSQFSLPRRRSLRSPHPAFATMDLRLILVAAPILLAASWAVFHIGRAAVGQLQLFIKRA